MPGLLCWGVASRPPKTRLPAQPKTAGQRHRSELTGRGPISRLGVRSGAQSSADKESNGHTQLEHPRKGQPLEPREREAVADL